jgi:site-specific DNA recombinase
MELFVVVSRLEEFAKTVAGSLDSIDFNSQREIIRALVKRVEIYKEEVNIVFRIEPQNDLSGNNGISTIKGKFMQHCKRSTDRALGRTYFTFISGVAVHHSCC